MADIRAKREGVYYRQRSAGNRAAQLEDNGSLVLENQHLLPPAGETNRVSVEVEDEELDNTIAHQKIAAGVLD